MKDGESLKKRLKSGQVVLGTWCVLPSAATLNVVASTGLDFAIIDMEHGPHSFETVGEMIRSAEAEGCSPLVRVPRNDEASILRALDLDAHGVVVPHIQTKEDALAAVRFAKYHPAGERGFSPFTRAGRYSPADVAGHAARQNERSLVTLILEGKKGIEQLDTILAEDKVKANVDVIYIGAYDLSQAMGRPGQVDHPEVKKAMENSVRKIKAQGIAAGGYVPKNKADLEWLRGIGTQFITLMPDCTLLYQAYERLVGDFRSLGK